MDFEDLRTGDQRSDEILMMSPEEHLQEAAKAAGAYPSSNSRAAVESNLLWAIAKNGLNR